MITRKTLFKGKRIDTGDWVIGDGIHYPKSINYIGTCWIGGFEKVANNWYQIDPNTLCLFTGIYDRTPWERLASGEQAEWLKYFSADEWKGKPIFDGDIVKHYNRYDDPRIFQISRVFWNKEKLCWGKKNPNGHVYIISPKARYVIIGNMFDTPELFSDAK